MMRELMRKYGSAVPETDHIICDLAEMRLEFSEGLENLPDRQELGMGKTNREKTKRTPVGADNMATENRSSTKKNARRVPLQTLSSVPFEDAERPVSDKTKTQRTPQQTTYNGSHHNTEQSSISPASSRTLTPRRIGYQPPNVASASLSKSKRTQQPLDDQQRQHVTSFLTSLEDDPPPAAQSSTNRRLAAERRELEEVRAAIARERAEIVLEREQAQLALERERQELAAEREALEPKRFRREQELGAADYTIDSSWEPGHNELSKTRVFVSPREAGSTTLLAVQRGSGSSAKRRFELNMEQHARPPPSSDPRINYEEEEGQTWQNSSYHSFSEDQDCSPTFVPLSYSPPSSPLPTMKSASTQVSPKRKPLPSPNEERVNSALLSPQPMNRTPSYRIGGYSTTNLRTTPHQPHTTTSRHTPSSGRASARLVVASETGPARGAEQSERLRIVRTNGARPVVRRHDVTQQEYPETEELRSVSVQYHRDESSRIRRAERTPTRANVRSASSQPFYQDGMPPGSYPLLVPIPDMALHRQYEEHLSYRLRELQVPKVHWDHIHEEINDKLIDIYEVIPNSSTTLRRQLIAEIVRDVLQTYKHTQF